MSEWKGVQITQLLIKPNGFTPLHQGVEVEVRYVGTQDIPANASWNIKFIADIAWNKKEFQIQNEKVIIVKGQSGVLSIKLENLDKTGLSEAILCNIGTLEISLYLEQLNTGQESFKDPSSSILLGRESIIVDIRKKDGQSYANLHNHLEL